MFALGFYPLGLFESAILSILDFLGLFYDDTADYHALENETRSTEKPPLTELQNVVADNPTDKSRPPPQQIPPRNHQDFEVHVVN